MTAEQLPCILCNTEIVSKAQMVRRREKEFEKNYPLKPREKGAACLKRFFLSKILESILKFALVYGIINQNIQFCLCLYSKFQLILSV